MTFLQSTLLSLLVSCLTAQSFAKLLKKLIQGELRAIIAYDLVEYTIAGLEWWNLVNLLFDSLTEWFKTSFVKTGLSRFQL